MAMSERMQDEMVEGAVGTLKAVAHPLRLRIIEALESGNMCVAEIVEAIKAPQALTSQQLGILRSRGILSARRERNRVYYSITNRTVIDLLDCIRRNGYGNT